MEIGFKMKQILAILAILLLLFFAFKCGEEKKPTNSDQEDPSYYFPINLYYKWIYASLGKNCIATGDTFVITAETKKTRIIDGISQSGWDLVLSAGGKGTGFVYRVGDTIFYWKDVSYTLPPYKLLVGPIKEGTYWDDHPRYDFEYSIVGFEDLYSSIAGETYWGCAKIKRIAPDDPKMKYFWWAPQFGKVKEAVYQSGECQQGEELKRLEKSPQFP